MSDDPVLKMYETQAGLEKIKEEMKEIQEQNNEISAKQNETTQVLNTNDKNLEEQTILLLGGDDGINADSLLILENNGQSWKQLNIKIPYSIDNHGAQFLNNNIYIFGGDEEEDILNSTYKLSKSLQWEKMADMNQRRNYISNSSVILNNQIWVCGGQDEDGHELDSVEMYDPETNKWKYIKEMNECRSSASTAVVNGKIFCSGGYVFSSVECYDPSSEIWTIICNMPKEIWGHSAVEIDGNLNVMGGWNKGYLNSVWALDTTDKSAIWIEKSSMSIRRYYFSIAKIHDEIYVCGGEFAGDNVEIFDGKVWRNGPKMPTIRGHAPAIVIPMEFAQFLN